MSVSAIQNPHPQSINRILAALPAEEYGRLAPHLKLVTMPRGEVLYNTRKPIEHVYFPLDSMISVVATTRDGSAVEVGVIGREGMSGLSVLMGVSESYADMMVQLPDSALRLEAETLLAEFERGGVLQKVLLRYTHAMLVMVSQTVACNRLHHISERLARWLLMCRDRAPSDELPLTHEFMAMMLGIRRAGVTETALTLQADGFIRYTRGRITIADRQGLEGYACECYSIVKDEIDKLYD